MIVDDVSGYISYPELRKFSNKLWLSEKMGYYCGPGGVSPSISGYYIVRPIINLRGMGIGSSRVWINKGDVSTVPPGYFWCEWFEGDHISVTYEKNQSIYAIKHCFQGFSSNKVGIFDRWEKTNCSISLPNWLEKEFISSDVKICNAEYIGEKLIEVHIRDTPDPVADVLIPIWDKKTIDIYIKLGYDYVDSYDDADGFLSTPRLGFVIK